MNFDIRKIIKNAENEVGYLEKKTNSNLYDKTDNAGYNNFTKYAYEMDTKYTTFYNGKKNGYPWCDCFYDWLMITSFGEANARTLTCQPTKSCGAGCEFSVKYYKAKNQFYTSAPKVGDQIFFKDSSGVPCHTGIVYDVDSKYVYTIEGNTSSASGVVANGGSVAKKKYSLTYASICGYGRPKYGDQSEFTTTATTTTTKPAATTNTFAKFTAYVKTSSSNLNVREKANTSSTILGSLKTGTAVTVIGESGNFYKINYGSKQGYISKTYTTTVKPVETFKAYNVKVTAKNGLNIRNAAKLTGKVIGVLSYNSTVKITKVSGSWGYVGAKSGWVYLSYTKKV